LNWIKNPGQISP